MIKGLRDIKTMSAISHLRSQQQRGHKTLNKISNQNKFRFVQTKLKNKVLSISKIDRRTNNKLGIDNGAGLASNLQLKDISRQVLNKKSLKTWVFTKEPKLARLQKSLHIKRVEEPHVDIYDNTTHIQTAGESGKGKVDSITIIAQIPVARERDIKFDIKSDILTLEADVYCANSTLTRYYKEVILPFEAECSCIKSTFKNGILQIDLEKDEK
ncbi:MAG: Hsp20 family protein [Planctomycetota bacterium]